MKPVAKPTLWRVDAGVYSRVVPGAGIPSAIKPPASSRRTGCETAAPTLMEVMQRSLNILSNVRTSRS